MASKEMLTAEEIDELADAGEVDMTEFIVFGPIRQPNREKAAAVRKATYSFPGWVVDEAERKAKRVAVSRPPDRDVAKHRDGRAPGQIYDWRGTHIKERPRSPCRGNRNHPHDS